jgi:hypothetical protein
MTTHRVPMLGSGLRRFEDPEQSTNPQIRALVAELRALPPDAIAPAPRAHFRAELRTQLVAVAPRIIAESAAESAATAEKTKAEPSRAERASDSARSRFFGRPFRLAGAVLTACLLVLGGLVWQSQHAVPGDALYGLKRATEDVRLAFAGSDTARAKDYLGFAGTRVAEAQALVRRSLPTASGPVAAGRISPTTAALVRSTLGSADSDVRSASQLLTGEAAKSRSAAPLQIMRTWAPQQVRRLDALRAMLPAGALRQRTADSVGVVNRADARAVALSATVRHGCLSRSGTDAFGARPCSRPGTRGHRQHNGSGHHSGRGGRHSGSHSGHPSTGPGTGSPLPTPGGGSHGPRRGHRPGPKSFPPPSLPTTLPTLPTLPVPSSTPISLGSCGVSLPGVTLSNCPSH